jgi:preprotein translocase subunit SecY
MELGVLPIATASIVVWVIELYELLDPPISRIKKNDSDLRATAITGFVTHRWN